MKITMKRFLALLLAVLMIASVASCGVKVKDNDDEKGSSSSGGGKKEEVTLPPEFKDTDKIKDDPEGYLDAVLKLTVQEIQNRYSGSPLQKLAEASKSNSSTLGLTLSVDGKMLSQVNEDLSGIKSVSLGGTLYSDLDKGRFYLDAEAKLDSISADAKIYIGQDFIGVGSSKIIGDSNIYGFEPKNFSKQFSKSIFADEDSIMPLPLPDEVLDMIDEVLNAFQDIDFAKLSKESEEYVKELKDIISNISLKKRSVSLDSAKVDYLGKSTDGYEITFYVTGKDLGSTVEKTGDKLLKSKLFSKLLELLEQSGQDVSEIKDNFKESISDAVEELNESDAKIAFTLEVAKDLIVSADIVITREDDDGKVEIDVALFDDDGKTISVTVNNKNSDDKNISKIKSVVDSSKGYSHKLTMENKTSGTDYWGDSYAESTNVVIDTSWSKSGALTVDMTSKVNNDYGDGYVYDNEAKVYIKGDLTAKSGSFELKNGKIGTVQDDTTVELGIDLSFKDGAKIPTFKTKDLMTISEDDFAKVFSKVAQNVQDLMNKIEQYAG